MANVVIPPHHQSAPKEHPAEKQIRLAQEEIEAGKWAPAPDPEFDQARQALGIALGLGGQGPAVGGRPILDDFQRTYELDILGQHPRVLEALERMRHEVYKAPDPEKALEHTLALHELAEAASARQKWDGQGRWEGDENEEARYGQILTPQEFHSKLCAVIGNDRVFLSPHCVKPNPDARSGRVGLYVRNPLWEGAKQLYADKRLEAESIRQKGIFHLDRGKRLRKLALDAEADKEIELAGELAQHAMKILAETQAAERLQEPELARVATLQWPCGTEWMIMEFTEWGAVYYAKFLGWRTALLTMIRAGTISEEEAHKAFPVPSTPAASWYRQQLAEIRTERGVVA